MDLNTKLTLTFLAVWVWSGLIGSQYSGKPPLALDAINALSFFGCMVSVFFWIWF
jgi:hypothetical protein